MSAGPALLLDELRLLLPPLPPLLVVGALRLLLSLLLLAALRLLVPLPLDALRLLLRLWGRALLLPKPA